VGHADNNAHSLLLGEVQHDQDRAQSPGDSQKEERAP